MGIFSRGRKNAEPVDDEPQGVDELDVLDERDGLDELEGGDEELEDVDGPDATKEATDEARSAEEEPFNRTRGPFDADEIDGELAEVERVDLGALRIVPVDGMQLRLELDQEQQSVVSAHAVFGDSGVQLQAFAAPRTMGVWPDIRDEIAESVKGQGGSAEVVDGPLGRELVAIIPSRGAGGRDVKNQVRFLGVDGPRWFLRAVISGAAATDEAKAAPLVDLVRSVVVFRDDQARPPREALPLQVPSAPEAPPSDAESGHTGNEGDDRSVDDLKPFERGPEITEVR